MDITNNSGGPIVINRLVAYWVKSPQSQKLDQLFLNGVSIWNTSDPDWPSDIPAEGGGNWPGAASERTIPDVTTQAFVIQFSNDLQPSGYEVHIVFDIGCQAVGTK